MADGMFTSGMVPAAVPRQNEGGWHEESDMSKQLRALAFVFCGACATTADSQPPRDADGSQFGEEDTNLCEESSRTALAMDETAPNGVRPQDVADAVNGSHAATLTWADGSAS